MTEQQAKTFTQSIVDEIASTPIMFSPPTAVAQSETILGDVTDEEKRLFSLYRFYEREMEQVQLDSKFAQTTDAIEILHGRVHDVARSYQLYQLMLWTSIRRRLDVPCDHDIALGLRQDWKIVKTQQGDLVSNTLRKLFGV